MEFEWDDAKAAATRRKHGVPFEEAATIFDDPNVFVRYDAVHSEDEDRWNVIGTSSRRRVLSVTYTKRGEAIRIISARKSSRAEAREYGETQS